MDSHRPSAVYRNHSNGHLHRKLLMDIINNTEPMPHLPQGANGKWVWDGHTTARQRSVDGQEWLLKGAWRWVQAQKKAQAPLAAASVSQIVEFHRPKIKPRDFSVERSIKAVIIASSVIVAITFLLIALT